MRFHFPVPSRRSKSSNVDISGLLSRAITQSLLLAWHTVLNGFLIVFLSPLCNFDVEIICVDGNIGFALVILAYGIKFIIYGVKRVIILYFFINFVLTNISYHAITICIN